MDIRALFQQKGEDAWIFPQSVGLVVLRCVRSR